MRKSGIIEIKQNDTWSCMACCAAMITGETLQDVIDFVGHDGSAKDIKTTDPPDDDRGFSDYDIARYLLDRGYYYRAHRSAFTTPQKAYDYIEDANNERMKLTVEWHLGTWTILSVKSERLEGCEHAILLHDGKIYDPAWPTNGSERTVREYVILDLTAIEKAEWLETKRWNMRHNIKIGSEGNA